MSEFVQQLERYFRARFTLIVLVTEEEERVGETIEAACRLSQPGRPCRRWDLARGFRDSGNSSVIDPKTLLEQIMGLPHTDRTVYVLHDFHDVWKNDSLRRMLRTTSQTLKRKAATIVVTTPTRTIPEELREEAFVVEVPLPDEAELSIILDRLQANIDFKPDTDTRRRYLQAARGLTSSQALRAFSEVISSRGRFDDAGIMLVTLSKKVILRESEALEYFAADETPDNVGGLEVLKAWLRRREGSFTAAAGDYGLPQPKGVGLIGIPGTGKSLTAKLVSSMWRMPLVRLDVGALFGSLVGESEARLRRAIALAETVAPCVLWIDEIEKGFGSSDLDGGTSQRVFATILNWMQEKTKPVFIIATANDVSRLPPELMRRGRFDEIFFLDLPTAPEREDIFRVHLRRRRRNPEAFDVRELARVTEGFVGAEIEQCVIDAMYLAFEDERREVTTDDIRLAAANLIPLSISQRERIQLLRSWLAEGRAKSASFVEKDQAAAEFVFVEPPTY